MTRIPAEFWLVAQCCRWPADVHDSDVARWSPEFVDWQRVVRIATRHRVEALVWNRLHVAGIRIPDEPARMLKLAAEHTARENLRAAAECARLRRAFAAAGIPILFIKGVTLAMLAYGNLSLKGAHDIDMLVDPAQIGAAAEILTAAGYVCIMPEASTADRVADWHRLSKESVWRHPEGGKPVELHTRLADNPMLLPNMGVEPKQEVVLPGGIGLPTLPPDELFAYLCVHGTASGWYRLRWLADLGALIASAPPDELERRYRRASSFGAGRAPSVALLLCAEVLGLPIPNGLRLELRRQWIARAMARAALRKMTGRYLEREIHSFALGTLSLQLAKLFLLPGWRFRLSEASRLMVRPEDAFESGDGSSIGPLRRVGLLVRKLAQPVVRRSRGAPVR